MLNLNGSKFYAHWAGIFYTDKMWSHPKCVEKQYEMLHVLNGTVFIKEEDTEYRLTRGDYLLLYPGKIHEGYEKSTGLTSFYYAHFYVDDLNALPPLNKHISNFQHGYAFKEHIHLSNTPDYPKELLDISMLNLIAKTAKNPIEQANNSALTTSKIASEIYEWLRINASPTLKATDIALQFGYNSEYITRILKKHYNRTINELISHFIILNANNLLCNTNLSVKEIAFTLGFNDANLFSKFYKYHTYNTPINYRNRNSNLHMNNI